VNPILSIGEDDSILCRDGHHRLSVSTSYAQHLFTITLAYRGLICTFIQILSYIGSHRFRAENVLPSPSRALNDLSMCAVWDTDVDSLNVLSGQEFI
jgi:hypothetical protein